MQWYDSFTANNEMDIVNQLLTIKRCKKPEEVMSALHHWENEWSLYMDRTQDKYQKGGDPIYS